MLEGAQLSDKTPSVTAPLLRYRVIDLGVRRRIDGPALIEHKAFAIKVGVAILFKVFQNTAIELVNIRYARFPHEEGGYGPANPAMNCLRWQVRQAAGAA